MTLYRWAKYGLKSASGAKVKLETEWVGGTRVTSKEALTRFFARKNDVTYRELATEEQHHRDLEKQSEEARRILQEQGMLG
jgi:hypothetical protein